MQVFQDRRLRRLLAAMAANKRLDGGGGVLRERRGRGWRMDEVLAPVVLASCDVRDRWPPSASPSRTAESLNRFERLSLAARLTLAANLHEAEDLFKQGFPRVEADRRARDLAQGIGLDIDAWPRIPAALIVEALSTAAAALAAVGNEPPSGKRSLALHHLRGGLNIVGARIEGDLELYNAVLPFPVRLIGCVIDGAVVADHAQMASMDLSGSALRGISANFLRLNGSMRLRRTYCAGSVDFGGAHIGGVMDLSDSVVTPLLPQPLAVAFAGDRGAVNLSLSTIDNELRLSRARIYGGLTMKGAVVRRSMFLEKALICSPIASLAKMALDAVPTRTGLPELDRLNASMDTDRRVARAIFPDDPENPLIAAWRDAEVHGLPRLTQNPGALTTMHRLLAESMRARTCAIRADGARIEGSVFGRGVTTMGRLRIKYGAIQGGLHLDGTRLRSPRESFDTFDALEAWVKAADPSQPVSRVIGLFVRLKEDTKKLAQKQEKGRGESYALDIRETVIEGTVSLGPAILPDDHERPSEIHGAVIASQARIGSGLYLQAVQFSGAATGADDKPTLDVEHTTIGCDLDLRDATGVGGIKAAFCKIEGNLLLCGPPDRGPHADDSTFMVQPCRASGKLEFRSAEVNGDAWLIFHPEKGPDLQLRQLTVAGSLNILPMPVDEQPLQRRSEDGPLNDKAPMAPPPLARNHPDRATPTIPSRQDFKAIIDKANHRRRRPVSYEIPPPGIDLRSARATVFRHPPTAWPQQDALHLIGFVYETPGTIGPLGVGRFLDGLNAQESPVPVFADSPRRAKVWRLWRARLDSLPWQPKSLLAASIIGPAVMLLLEFRSLLAWGPLKGMAKWRPIAELDRLGLVNLGLLLGLTCFCLALRWMSSNLHPTKYDAKPLGAYWLRLQAQLPNPFRQRGRYAPTDPYLRAANALREVGKVRSAEWIELERVRARTRLLSLRHHFLARVALWTVDRLADYGFNVARVVFILAFTVLIGACMFEWSKPSPPPDGPQAASVAPSVVISLETVAPLLKRADEREPAYTGSPQPQPTRPPYVEFAAWLLRAFGLLLTAVIGASLAARAESFLSRMQT